MDPEKTSDGLHQDADGVRQFFEQWALYRKVVEQNYLHHREAYSAIEQVLQNFSSPFSFLDLGSGDASFTAAMLARCPIACYEAVDISETALELAKGNVAALPCPQKFTRGDFFRHVPELNELYDVVFIGLSFHHLPKADKQKFFPQMRRIIRAGGSFIFYEPVLNIGETREEVMRRFGNYADQWLALSTDEIQQVKAHVFGNDYPETVEDFKEMAQEAGFPSTGVLFEDGERLYAVFHCS